MATTTSTTAATISLKRIRREVAEIEVRGTAPLIVHRWSEKARQMMLDAQQGKKNPKQPKDPQQDFETSMYRFEDGGHGFPIMAFKSAMVKGGARVFGKAVKMTELRHGKAGLGKAGKAGPGAARLGMAWQGPARQARHGKARQGPARRGLARQGKAGEARRGKAGVAGRGLARQGLAWQGRQGKAGRGAAGQGEAGKETNRKRDTDVLHTQTDHTWRVGANARRAARVDRARVQHMTAYLRLPSR